VINNIIIGLLNCHIPLTSRAF